jgi:hypothetical protein
MGPWQKIYYNFLLVTSNQEKPTPTSLVHRACSDEVTSIMLAHCENDHFALASKQPLRRERFPAILSADSPHFFPEYSLTPRQADHLIYALKHCSVLFLHVQINMLMLVCSGELYVTLTNPCLHFLRWRHHACVLSCFRLSGVDADFIFLFSATGPCSELLFGRLGQLLNFFL